MMAKPVYGLLVPLKMMFPLDCPLVPRQQPVLDGGGRGAIRWPSKFQGEAQEELIGEHHQRKAPLMMMDPGLSCRAQVVLWRSVVLFLLVVIVCGGPEESTGVVGRTEDAEAQDMRCRAQVVWWRTDGQSRASVDSRMVTSRADPLAEAC